MVLPERKSTRLKGFDYSRNKKYFVTICVQNKANLFGNVFRENMILSDEGKVAENLTRKIGEKYPSVKVEQYVIMPNHIHLLLAFSKNTLSVDSDIKLENVIGWYKYFITKEINKLRGKKDKIFQRSFHDHIIRNQNDYEKIWNYIKNNPRLWKNDCFYIN